MKLGVSMWSYFAAWKRGDMDIPGFIHEAARLNLDGVELLEFFWKDRAAEMPLVKLALRETGLPVGVYSVSNNFAKADAAERAAQVQVITNGVDTAIEFGANVVRVFAGDVRPGLTFDAVREWIIEGLREAAAYAQSAGIILALENHGTLAGRSDQVLGILADVGSPALRANPDTGNFFLVHEPPHDAVAKVATHAGMAHLKDFREVPPDYDGFAYEAIDGLKFAGTAVGEGDVALQACVDELRQGRFDGWVNIEYEASEDPMTGVARSAVNARAMLQ